MKKVMNKWRESLNIFSGKELMILLFATAKTYKRTLSLIFRYYWWLLALDILMHSLFTSFLYFGAQTVLTPDFPFGPVDEATGSKILLATGVIYLVYLCTELLLSFYIFLSVRTSIEPKRRPYYRKYLHKIGGYSIIFFLLILGSYLFPLAGLAALFYFDSKGRVGSVWQSLKNGTKAVCYFFPVVVIFVLLGWFLNLVVSSILGILTFWKVPITLLGIVLFTIKFFVLLALISLLANWYLKIKHGYYELFFPPSR